MKLRVYADKDTIKEKTVFLRLKDIGDGVVRLEAVDECGDRLPSGNILQISEKGVYRYAGFSSILGFKVVFGSQQIVDVDKEAI